MKQELNLNNLIIAHRGVHNNIDIPENTLPAFKKALTLNLPIELDIQLTKDNILVVFHDNNLLRLTSQNKNIKDITYEELSKLNILNTEEKIPTLKQVLDLIKGKVLINIEIKNTKNIKTIATLLIKELELYPNNYIIQSFNPIIIHHLKKNNPTLITGLLIGTNYPNKLKKYLCTNYLTILFSNTNFLSLSKKLITQSKYQKYKNKYPIILWTIETKEELFKYQKENYSCICNNIETIINKK